MDDFACALFGPAIFVTFSYYVTQFLPLTEPIYGDDYQVVCHSDLPYCKKICGPMQQRMSMLQQWATYQADLHI